MKKSTNRDMFQLHRDEMEVVREKSLSPELRQNPERPELRGGERLRGFEASGTSGNLERLRGFEGGGTSGNLLPLGGSSGASGNLEKLGGRQLSESSAELPKRFIITKDQKSGEVRDSSHILIG